MCVIFFAYQAHPDYDLILLANRDESHQRPTKTADFWSDYPYLLAGKDLEAGGTWLGITKEGKFSALTNIQSSGGLIEEAPSRGHLVKDYLLSDLTPQTYLQQIGHNYNGFNQLVGDPKQLYHYNSQDNITRELPPGIYGVSNASLNTPWPKVTKGIDQLSIWCGSNNKLPFEKMLNFMQDTMVPADEKLPDTGAGVDVERTLGSIFVLGEDYGTRCTSLLMIGSDGKVRFTEQSYGTQGTIKSQETFTFLVTTR